MSLTIKAECKSQGIEEFNPNNLPLEKFGKCEFENHYEIVDYPNLKCKLRLMMYFSDEYMFEWVEKDNSLLDSDEFDKRYDKYEKVKWKSNSELYCCEPCSEELGEL